MASADAKRMALAANAGLLFAAILAGASVVATRVAIQSVPPSAWLSCAERKAD
jgi:hypothetical protein